MARFRKARRGFRRMAKSARRRFGRASENPLMIILPAMAYGAGRQYLSQAVEPLTSKVPLGTFADEAVFGTAGYFMAKKGKGIIKSLGKAILTVEAASVGNQIVNKATDNGMSSDYNY